MNELVPVIVELGEPVGDPVGEPVGERVVITVHLAIAVAIERDVDERKPRVRLLHARTEPRS